MGTTVKHTTKTMHSRECFKFSKRVSALKYMSQPHAITAHSWYQALVWPWGRLCFHLPACTQASFKGCPYTHNCK